MSRPIPLTTIGGGINRLRVKGNADSHSLFDLLNGYVTQANTIKVRPGTFRAYNIATYSGAGTTKGLVSYQGIGHVFSSQLVSVPPNFQLHILLNPNQTTTNIPILEIHFAAPYLGGLYVVAEFTDNNVYHYWIQFAAGGPNSNFWAASTDYSVGDVVIPNPPNGFTYIASRLFPAQPIWSPNTQVTVGSIVEPTVPNGFAFVCTATTGPTPATSDTEPTWPTKDGAQVVESNVATTVATVLAAATDPTPGTPPRYVGLYPTSGGGGIGGLR